MVTAPQASPVPRLHPDGAARLALGTMRLLDWGLPPRGLADFLLRVAEARVRVLDTADIYGGGAVEPALGEAFRAEPALRKGFFLVGKCGIRLPAEGPPKVAVKHYDTSRGHVAAQVEGTLRHLGVERLDLLLIHRPDPLMDASELAEAVAGLQATGKVGAFGVSNFTPSQAGLLQARLVDSGAPRLAANQIEASLWHPEPLWDGTLDQAQREGLVPMAWSPLGGGLGWGLGGGLGGGRPAPPALAAALQAQGRALGLQPAQVALAWLARHPAGLLPVLGTGRLDRIREAVTAMEQVLDREAWFGLLEAATGHPVA